MPTYEFRCPDGHTFDRFYRKMSDAVAELECPVCGKLASRQLSGGAGLVFKGSGFYLTDYGKNAHRESGTAKRDTTDKTKTDGASSGESKPAESKPAEKAAEPASKNTKPAESKSSGSAGPSSTSGGKSDS